MERPKVKLNFREYFREEKKSKKKNSERVVREYFTKGKGKRVNKKNSEV